MNSKNIVLFFIGLSVWYMPIISSGTKQIKAKKIASKKIFPGRYSIVAQGKNLEPITIDRKQAPYLVILSKEGSEIKTKVASYKAIKEDWPLYYAPKEFPLTINTVPSILRLPPLEEKLLVKNILLFIAAKYGDTALIDYLLADGANINGLIEPGESGILIRLLELDPNGNENRTTARVVQHLIKNGANVNQKNKQGITPIMAAAMFGLTNSLKELLKASPDINAQNLRGDTALHIAIRMYSVPNAPTNRYVEIIQELINAGASQTIKNNEGLDSNQLLAQIKKTQNPF